jgi:hypothetical protein
MEFHGNGSDLIEDRGGSVLKDHIFRSLTIHFQEIDFIEVVLIHNLFKCFRINLDSFLILAKHTKILDQRIINAHSFIDPGSSFTIAEGTIKPRNISDPAIINIS